MTLPELLHRANQGYPDSYLAYYYNTETGAVKEDGSGDTLAEFVVRELIDTFEDDKPEHVQILESQLSLRRAVVQLEGVIAALDTRPTVPIPKEELPPPRPRAERTRVINLD